MKVPVQIVLHGLCFSDRDVAIDLRHPAPDGLHRTAWVAVGADTQCAPTSSRLSIQRPVDHRLYHASQVEIPRVPHHTDNLPRPLRRPGIVEAQAPTNGCLPCKKAANQCLIHDDHTGWTRWLYNLGT